MSAMYRSVQFVLTAAGPVIFQRALIETEEQGCMQTLKARRATHPACRGGWSEMPGFVPAEITRKSAVPVPYPQRCKCQHNDEH